MLIDPNALFAAVEATWPAFSTHNEGIWILREGRGAGQRVSAASTEQVATEQDVEQAAKTMQAMGQKSLFMVRGEQPELDDLLASMGYRKKDPVDLLVASCADLADYSQPDMKVIFAPDPMPIQAEIWAAGGVDAPRLDVMRHVVGPKTCLLGRHENHPVAAAFLACHKNIAMVHAVEVLSRARRQGIAKTMMRGAAWWALQQGAEWFCCLTVSENLPAQRLYRKMGMETAAQYHYRVAD